MIHERRELNAGVASEVVAALARLRARMRLVLVLNRVLLLLAVILGGAVVLGLTDYLVRLPEWIRWLHWTLGVGGIGYSLWRFVRPTWRFAPSLTDLALRVERDRPEVRGLLASAVDFAAAGDASRAAGGSRLSESLAGIVRRRADDAWRRAGAARFIRPGASLRAGALMLAAFGVATSLAWLSPSLWTIGALRLSAPWMGAAWPKRTGIADMTEGAVHARGTALPLRAAVVKSNRPWDETYVAVHYRLVAGGERSGERRELLTWQGRDVETPYAEPGALFERLVEPVADAIEFRFETEDDATNWREIRLVPPPAVVSASALITPPEYARQLLADGNAGGRAEQTTADLGPGTDERAVAPPALAGSRVELTVVLNKPVEMPEAVAEVFVDPETPMEAEDRPVIERRGSTWLFRWTLAESLRVPIRLRDEFGIESADEAVYRFEALTDRPAAATIVDPTTDRTVLPSAVVPVSAEGRDDVGLAWVSLEQTVWTPAGEPGAKSPPGGALEQRGDAVASARIDAAGQTLARTSIEVDLATLDLKPGDEVRLTALAVDVRTAGNGSGSPTRSAPRTLRVISEEDFVEEVQRTLAEVRQAAIRVSEQQQGLKEQTQIGRADIDVRRGQGSITDRLARQSETVQRLIERMRENRLEERGLDELLGRAKATINDAGQASGRASRSLEQASARGESESPSKPEADGPTPGSPESQGKSPTGSPKGQSPGEPGQSTPGQQSSPQSGSPSDSAGAQPPRKNQPDPVQAPPQAPAQDDAGPVEPPPTDDPDLREAAAAQQEVQDQLRTLIELLDRGEDNWLARNTIERILREQKELREHTQQAGRQTAGKTADQLTSAQRTELDQIVEKQNQLADQTGDLARDMRQREESLREKDPAAAQGMAAAARRAEQSQVSQTMRNAASEAGQNQTSRASRQQQQAEEALEEMLEDLDRVDKARDEVLRRELASIIETLEGLIRRQGDELASLEERIRARKDLDGLDDGMIRLNQNTLEVSDQIKAAGPEAAPIGTLVSRAGDAQTSAITEIRRPVVGPAMVREYEGRSLTLLKQALEKAKEIDNAAAERERRKRLGELKRAYREILERQVAIQGETQPLAEIAEPSRRDRMLARGLAERQDAVGGDLRQLLTQTAEMKEAKVFDYAHVRMDAFSRTAAESLNDARAGDALAAEASLIKTLKNVIKSLDDPKPDEQKFAEGAGGGGGGGGANQGALLPPVKELMLLRQMQTDLAEETVFLSKAEGAPPKDSLQDLGKAQRELMNVGREFVDRLKQSQQPGTPNIEPAEPEKEGPDGP